MSRNKQQEKEHLSELMRESYVNGEDFEFWHYMRVYQGLVEQEEIELKNHYIPKKEYESLSRFG